MIKDVVDIFVIMRQNSEESFGAIMNIAVKMAEDMNIAVDKSRVAKRSVYQAGAVISVPSRSSDQCVKQQQRSVYQAGAAISVPSRSSDQCTKQQQRSVYQAAAAISVPSRSSE